MKRALMAAILFSSLSLGGIVPQVGAAGPDIQDGLWEMTMETQMEGLPVAMPPVAVTVTQCISRNDPVVRDQDAGKNCRVLNQKISGNKVSWEIECTDSEAKVAGKGEMAYSGSTCKGVTKMVMTLKDGEKMTSTIRMKGHRIGACPPGGAATSATGKKVRR